jgi:PilZ domain
MPRKLLQIFPGMCRHEFGWPRKTPDGDYYQVCLLCGDEYQYDWPTMQRLGKRAGRTAPKGDVARRPTWSPRARRLKIAIPVEFRSQTANEMSGTVENVSQSGLFIRSEQSPAKGDLIEMTFNMPMEISGQDNAAVICAGQVVRIVPSDQKGALGGFAVSVIDYRFLHSGGRVPHASSSTV